jgi:Zn-dependent peptidase ImmA (M78 family)
LEISRKCTTPIRIANQTNLPKEVVEDYLKSDREIQFDELRPICDSLKIGLMWLLSPNYKPSHLTFRALADQDLTKVSRIENAFLIIGNVLPQIKKFSAPKLNISEKDPAMLQAEINGAVSDLRQKYPTVEALYNMAGLPILSVSAGANGFDAFIMNSGKSSVVCVNKDKSPARIHFSLLHEMAHFLWHREQDIPVDVFIEGYFNNDLIAENNIPEYVANKFAQQFIFSLKEMESIAPKWKTISNIYISELIAERRTTIDVLAFAIYDYLKFTSKPVNFLQIRDAIKANASIRLESSDRTIGFINTKTTGYNQDTTILEFIEQRGNELKKVIHDNKEEFSDSVWSEIEIAWELGID